MVFGYFNRSRAILPTPENILYGIVLAQIDEIKSDHNYNFNLALPYVDVWKKIFEMVKNIKLNEPLTPKILSNPNHNFVKTLIYIYSM